MPFHSTCLGIKLAWIFELNIPIASLSNYPYNSPIYGWPMNFPENTPWIPIMFNHCPAPADSAWKPQRRIFKDGLTIHQVLHCNGNPHLGPSGRAVGSWGPNEVCVSELPREPMEPINPSRVSRVSHRVSRGTHRVSPGSPGESKGRRPWRCPRPQRFPRSIRHSIASQSPAPESCTKGDSSHRLAKWVLAI